MRKMTGTGAAAIAGPLPFCAATALRCAAFALVLLAALLTTTNASRAVVMDLSEGDNVGRVSIPVNKSETVRLDTTFAEVLVGSPDIADVLPLTDRSVYILAKQVGTTNISIIDSQRRLIGVIDLEVTLDIGTVEARIRQVTGNANIRVTSNGGQIVLSGEVSDAPTVDRAMQIATQFAGGNVINAISVAGTQQVMLKVRFIEATRTAGRDLGLRWDVSDERASVRIGREQLPTFSTTEDEGLISFPGAPLDTLFPLISGATPVGVVLANLVNDGINIDVLVQALEDKGLARNLAEPNLVALSGDTADFLAGGEFPVPVPDDDGIAIEYREFGVGLAFTPTVLRDGHINLKIEPEVSQLDFSSGVTVGGVSVPGLTTRRASTTIELRDGQSFAIAGLLQSNSRREIAQLPWIGNLPVIGALFRSTSFQNTETDLVIIVTPYLVQPAAPGNHVATPLDSTLPGNDVDLFLMGNMELQKEYRFYVEDGGDVEGPYGHMLGLEYGYPGAIIKGDAAAGAVRAKY